MNQSDNIGSFKVPGHSTKREWSVYLVVANNQVDNLPTKIYVGKTGDNRKGCNPVISRVGNHFSFNKIHSQIRNKIQPTEDYDYEYFYAHFGAYEEELGEEDHKQAKDRINELERELNRMVQKRPEFDLINKYGGKHIPKKEKARRADCISDEDRAVLTALVKIALG